MRQESAASVKGTVSHSQLAPREGTKLRALYDLFAKQKGAPFEANIYGNREFGSRRAAVSSNLTYLRDFYGLDIRCLKRGSGNRWGRPPSVGTWVLAGEWFGRTYVDYIADRIAKADREARQ